MLKGPEREEQGNAFNGESEGGVGTHIRFFFSSLSLFFIPKAAVDVIYKGGDNPRPLSRQ